MSKTEKALNIALARLGEAGLHEQMMEVLRECDPHFLLRYHRDKEGVMRILRTKIQAGSIVVRITGPVELPCNGPDHKSNPNKTYSDEWDWSGVLIVLKPGTVQSYCTRDFGSNSEDECEAGFLRFGWGWGAVPILNIYPEGIMDWETMTPKIPNVEIAYLTVTDMEVAHENYFKKSRIDQCNLPS